MRRTIQTAELRFRQKSQLLHTRLGLAGIKISRRTPYSPGRSASSPIRRFSMGALPFLFLWFLIQNIQKSTVL